MGRVASPDSLFLLALSTNPVSCRSGELGTNRYTNMEMDDAQMIRAVAAALPCCRWHSASVGFSANGWRCLEGSCCDFAPTVALLLLCGMTDVRGVVRYGCCEWMLPASSGVMVAKSRREAVSDRLRELGAG